MKLAGAMLVLALVACVDNSGGADAAAPGSLGGPCFSNNTCNAGLACALVNGKGICQESDASAQDATTSDVIDDVTTDAADAGCTLQKQLACGQTCEAGVATCCFDTQICEGPIYCLSGNAWQCQTQGDCQTNQHCCLTATISNPNACPNTGQVQANAQCSQSCGSGYALCTTDSDCPNQKCVAVSLTGNPNVLGLCM